MLDAVNDGRLSLERLVDLLAHGPQRVYGMASKGRLVVGYDADLTIVDMQREHVISDDEQASRAGWTPFAGRRVRGWPVRTIVRGHSVMIDGQLQGAPSGRPVRFVETLEPLPTGDL
jgi:dihydroorotase